MVVDGNVTNNQGIVRCTTTITGLQRHSYYSVVYSDSNIQQLLAPSTLLWNKYNYMNYDYYGV